MNKDKVVGRPYLEDADGNRRYLLEDDGEPEIQTLPSGEADPRLTGVRVVKGNGEEVRYGFQKKRKGERRTE